MSLQQIQSLLKNTRSVVKNGKVVINQITCNPDGSRFVFILGSFGQQADIWSFALLSANADGSAAYVLSDHFCSSHYHWRDENHLLIFQWRSYGDHVSNSGLDEGAGLYLLRDKTQEHELIDPECGFFRVDGHCSYSPDRMRILYDSYPENNYQHLYVYDIHGRNGRRLASLYALPVSDQDIRCDLHPRWDPQGKIISFDSTHENRRHIYLAQIG